MDDDIVATSVLKSRLVRVFISSTFRDMREERELLVKRVFPEMRACHRQRGVEIVDIDLRWGITEGQAERGETLPVCFAEIDRCRPWFIVLLGERYGWVPQGVDRALQTSHPWLACLGGASVTELEIVYGILRDPARARHALFYFRDPAYIESVPLERRADFLPEDAASTIKLRALKERIRHGGFALRENYAGLEALGAAVMDDLGRIIEQEFPTEPTTGDAAESALHEAFAEDRRHGFSGFTRELNTVHEQLQTSPVRLVIRGGEGSGKSALLAELANQVPGKRPGILQVAAFIGATAESAQWEALLRFLTARLQMHEGRQAGLEVGSNALGEFARTLASAAAARPVLLMLDGIDRFDDRFAAESLRWLPREIPENVSVILSARSDFSTDALEARGFEVLELGSLPVLERSRLITSYLDSFGKRLDGVQIAALVNHPAGGRPLFLRATLQALRLRADFSSLQNQLDSCLTAQNLRELYERILAGLEQDTDALRPGLVRDALSLLCVTRTGLSETELRELLGQDGEPLSQAFWSPLRISIEGALIDRAGYLALAQDSLREAVHIRWFRSVKEMEAWEHALAKFVRSTGSTADPRMYQTHFLEHERKVRRKLGEALFPLAARLDNARLSRALDEGTDQLIRAEAWPALYKRLADRWVLRQASRLRQELLIRAWRELEQHSQFRVCDAFHESIETPGMHPASDGYLVQLLEALGHAEAANRLRRGSAAASDDPLAHAAAHIGESRKAESVGAEDRAIEGYFRAYEKYHRALLDFGASERFADAIAGCALRLAECFQAREVSDVAARFLNEAELFAGEGPLLPLVLLTKARFCFASGKLHAAQPLAEASATAGRERRDLCALRDALSLLATIYGRTGQRDKAIRALRERERIASFSSNG
jgi:nephrocystin-3